VSQSRATSGMKSDFVRCRKQFSQEFGSDHGANPKVLTVPGAPNARRPGSRRAIRRANPASHRSLWPRAAGGRFGGHPRSFRACSAETAFRSYRRIALRWPGKVPKIHNSYGCSPTLPWSSMPRLLQLRDASHFLLRVGHDGSWHVEHTHAQFLWFRREPWRCTQNSLRGGRPLLPQPLH
jgi:hypothetical protein